MHQLQRHATLLFAAACEVMHTAQAEHLRAVLGGGDMANLFALVKHRCTLIAQIPVGVDLHLQAAVTEDTFGDHGDHVHALGLGSDDEGCGFVIGVSGGCANAGDKHAALCAVHRGQSLGGSFSVWPRLQGQRFSTLYLLTQKHHGVQAHQQAIVVGIAVTRTDSPFRNMAQHRTSVALHLALTDRSMSRFNPLQTQRLSCVRAGQSVGMGVAGVAR